MRTRTLAGWLLALGVAVWLSGGVFDMRPTFALIVVPAVLTFGAFATRPPRS